MTEVDTAPPAAHDLRMGGAPAAVRHLPTRRALFLDERGAGLRLTWHHDRGFANLSVWRGDRCQETFRLSTADAAQVIAFLADGLGEAAASNGPVLRAAPAAPSVQGAGRRAHDTVAVARRRLAGWLRP